MGETAPYWTSTATFPRFAKLSEDLTTDVVVIGAGITGLSAAYLLARGGKRVVVLEGGRCATRVTGHTSGHLTMVTDARMSELVERFGPSDARAVWDAGVAAIATIDEVVREHAIDAGFARVDGYLHAPLNGGAADETARLKEEAALASGLGFQAEYVEAAPLFDRPGIRFADQARMQPRAYLAGVAKAFVAMGGRIFEHSAADESSGDPRAVTVNRHTVRCADVVMATHNPQAGVTLALHTSYVIAGRAPAGTVPDALWWDTGQRYHYLRVEPHRNFDLVIFGGEDHKPGPHDDAAARYRRLETRLDAVVPEFELTHRWSGQIIETPDGLPRIGRNAAHQYVATGYSGNGLTFGTLAGMMISDAILERPNPWAAIFDPGRAAPTKK